MLTYGGRLACEAARVSGPELGFIATRGACVPLERPEMVRVERVASSGEVTLRHQDDCVAVGPLPAAYYQDKRLAAGETITAPFAPCTWEIGMSTELGSPTDFTLRLARQ